MLSGGWAWMLGFPLDRGRVQILGFPLSWWSQSRRGAKDLTASVPFSPGDTELG